MHPAMSNHTTPMAGEYLGIEEVLTQTSGPTQACLILFGSFLPNWPHYLIPGTKRTAQSSSRRSVVSDVPSASWITRAKASEVSQHRGMRQDSGLADVAGAALELDRAQPLPIVMRATNGKGKASRGDRIKIRTLVQPAELDGFFTRYAEVCKARMQGLKRRDKSKKKRAKRRKRPANEA